MIEPKRYLQEIVNRIDYFFKQIDGTHKYPNGQTAQICMMIKEYKLSMEQKEQLKKLKEEKEQ